MVSLGIYLSYEAARKWVNMAAGNLYADEGKDNKCMIAGHDEYDKFKDEVIVHSYGLESFLSIGMLARDHANGITAVPSRNGSVNRFRMNGLCMDFERHCVCLEHLIWRYTFDWRLAKILRSVKECNIKAAKEHYRIHVGMTKERQNRHRNKNKRKKTEYPRLCKCVDARHKPPFNFPCFEQ